MAVQRTIQTLAWAAALAATLLVSACNAPGNTPAGESGVAAAPMAAPSPAQSPAPATPPAEQAPESPPQAPVPVPVPVADATGPASGPLPGPVGKPGLPSMSLGADSGRSCRNDSDCAMKDAGSCCGYRPICVNRDTPTFPEKVQAACARDGRVGICGFPAIDGCRCTAGKCEGVLMMENSVPLQ